MNRPAPAWDIDLQKELVSGKRRFSIDVRFQSDARRLVLFGPSGAGKSQALKMIAGLSRPDSGHVRIDGLALFDSRAGVDARPQQRNMAYLFQDYALFPHLTVLQNVAFPLTRGWLNPRRGASHEIARQWLARLQLEPLAHLLPDQLSGGQRQRVAIARAVVAAPRALLLDEPFAALDKALRMRLRDELAQLQAQLQIPMILITHDEDDVEHFGDAVIQIFDGRIVETSSATFSGREKKDAA